MKMDVSIKGKSKFGKASLKDKNLGRSPHRSTDQVQKAKTGKESDSNRRRRKPKLNSHIPIKGYNS